LAAEVNNALGRYGLPIFEGRTTQRVVYAEALSMGSSVLDLEPAGLAAQEINALLQELRRFVA